MSSKVATLRVLRIEYEQIKYLTTINAYGFINVGLRGYKPWGKKKFCEKNLAVAKIMFCVREISHWINPTCSFIKFYPLLILYRSCQSLIIWIGGDKKMIFRSNNHLSLPQKQTIGKNNNIFAVQAEPSEFASLSFDHGV